METPRPGTPGTGTAYAQQTAPPRAPAPPTQNAGEAVDEAKDAVQQVAGQVQETGKQVVEQVQEQAFTKVSEQIGRMTETLGSVVDATRSVSSQLRQSDQAMVAGYVDQAATQMEKLAGYLGNKEPSELVADFDRFARRQPAVFMGGAFVLGLMAARFLKSSSYHNTYRYENERYSYGEPGYYNPYASTYAAGYVPRGVPQPPPYGGTANPPPMGGNKMPVSRGGNLPTTTPSETPPRPQSPPYEPTV